MTQEEMITIVARHCDCTRPRAADALVELFAAIAQDLAEGETPVRLPALGSLSRHAVPAHPGRNPRTGERLTIADGHRFRFKPAKAMKERLVR